ncbi:hypothetical protein HDU81_011198 [Chytriomyces hyalinus]|nr:hypothetical protein HDU81_011198 [Chytriomyces hyalinus]
MRNKLHTALTSIPVTKTAWFAYKTVRYLLVGSGVYAMGSVDQARMLFHVKNSAFLYALTGVLCTYKIEFMFSFWTFGIAAFYYLFWTINVHIQNTVKYCAVLKVKLDSIRTSGGVNSIGIPGGTAVTGLRSRRRESVPVVQNDGVVAADTGVQAEVVDTGTASFFQFARQEIMEWVREASWELVFPKRPEFPRDVFLSRVALVGEEWNLLWTMESKLWMVK